MRIVYSNTTLASSDPAVGRMGPADLSFNGQPVIQVEELFRASAATVFHRGDGPDVFSFSVEAGPFVTEGDVINFCALHRSTLPGQADLQLFDDAGTVMVVMANAVRQVSFTRISGLSVRVEYQFTGAGFASETIPEAIEENTDRLKVGTTNPATNDETVAVTFANPFGGVPRYVNLNIESPVGQPTVLVSGYNSVTAAGFVAQLASPIPASGYKSRWQAVL